MIARAARIYLALLLLLLVGCSHTAVRPAPALTGSLVVQAPARAHAADPVAVRVVRADAPDGTTVTLAAQGSYGTRLYRAAFARGQAQFVVPGEHTRWSGVLTLAAVAGAARGEAGVQILPGPPVDPVTPLVGPRTVVADAAHWSMAVAIPFDSYGNPVADGTPVTFRVMHPGSRLEELPTATRHHVAWQRITSGTLAGRTTVTALAGDAHGPEATFLETPGWPVTMELRAEPQGVPADGRQLITLRAENLRDRFGNAMLDGTLVTFAVEPPDGRPRFIPAFTIDGVAEAQLQAPDTPGVLSVRATLFGIESDPLQISFAPGPAVGTFALHARVDTRAGGISLTTGALLGALGQLVPDGTVVALHVVGPDGWEQQLRTTTVDGRAQVELRLAALPAGTYRVEARAGAGRGQTTFSVP